ncbi:MAG: flagellar hook-length control protein FliK [Methyloprofundus sp.]|nr:flagellar hook-length control protein FliK [Methyloprofundus sp.]
MTASVLSALSPVAMVSDSSGGLNNSPRMATGEKFSAAFLQQIKGLQAQASETTKPSSVLEKIADLIKGQEGQDFSILLGDSLPQIKQQMQAQAINLDETMTALKDILAQLDALSIDSKLPAATLQGLAAKLESGAITDTGAEVLASVDGQERANEEGLVGDMLSVSAALAANVSADKLTHEVSGNDLTKTLVSNAQETDIDKQAIGTLDLAADLSSSLTQVNQPAVLKAHEPRHYSGADEDDKQAEQDIIVDAQPVAINLAMQQTESMTATDDQAIAQTAQAGIAQLLKQEKNSVQDKNYTQTTLLGEQGAEDEVKPEINLGQLLKREKLINSSADFASLDNVKGAQKTVDSALLSTSQSGSEQAHNKFSTADLMALNRQVESAVPKQELTPMTRPFNHPEWQQEFNERIIWMHTKSIPSAQLRLNPQGLGPISIQINVDKDQQASIVFNAQNAGVREAIEASMPKLREMLNAQQVNLAEVNVSQQQQQGQGSARQAMQEAMSENNRNNARNSVDSSAIEPGVNDIAEEINQGRAVASKGILSIYA